jgi:Protein of unknown function (DUF1501)
MNISRRDALFGALFGGSMLGLRSLATGLPVKMLMNPKKAMADMQAAQCLGDPTKKQYIIFVTSGQGDPMGCDAPGTYDDPSTGMDLSTLVHPDITQYNYMTPAASPFSPMSMPGKPYTAAGVWGQLAPWASRTCLCHIMTDTPVHPKEPQVLQLMGSTQYSEMFPSVLAKQLAPCLQTLQTQPLSVGALTPSEGLTFGGQALPTIPPTALSATLTSQTSSAYAGMTKLQSLRDSTLQDMYSWYSDASQTTPAQKNFIDSMVTSQQQVLGIKQNLLSMLSGITANDNNGQITAAVTLIMMGVAPVIAVHFPFGGDNHSDPLGFKSEATEHQSGIAAFVQLLQALQTNGIQDQVSVVTLNVFGRTMAAYNTAGRQHNEYHQMSMMIGKPFAGGVIGGLAPVTSAGAITTVGSSNFFDFGSLPFDLTSGLAQKNGGTGANIIQPIDQLASWGATVLTAVGASPSQVTTAVTDPNAKVISAALAPT